MLNDQSVLSLSDQLNMFNEYVGKLKELVGAERTNFIIENSVYLVVAGSDDLANTYFTIGIRRIQYDIDSYTDFLVQNAIKFITVNSLFLCNTVLKMKKKK